MKATQKLHALGQSIWLDNITRDLLTSGTLRKYIDDLSVTGLTSNPSIFDHAVARSHSYDADIKKLAGAGKADEALFFELAIADLTQAADLFAPIYQRTAGVDGFVSLEVSPLLAHDTARTVAEARGLHAKANKPNLFIKIPRHDRGSPRHRGNDLRRRAGQRHAVVLARSLCRGGGRLHARPGTSRRCGPEP